MTIYKIGTLNNEPELKENLFKEIKFLNREGIHVNISEKTVGKTLFINCSVADPDTEIQNAHEKILRFYLSNIITDLLMNEVTKSFIYRIIKHRYLESYEFGADEFCSPPIPFLITCTKRGILKKLYRGTIEFLPKLVITWNPTLKWIWKGFSVSV
jgi:hypothetical protein